MDQLSLSIEKHSRDVLPTVTRVFNFVYLIIGCSHLLLLPDDLTLTMSTLAFSTLAFGVFIRYSLDSAFIQIHTEAVLVCFVVLGSINTLVHLYLTQDIKHTTNLVFVLAVSGYLLPRNRTYFPVLGFVLIAWLAIVPGRLGTGSDLAHFGFELLLGCLLSIMLQMLRRSQLQQLGDLEQSVAQLNLSQQQVTASQSLMQSLIDNIPAGIIVRGTDTRIRFLNQEARNLLGFEDVDPTGLPIGEDPLELFDQNGRKLMQTELPVYRVLETGEPIVNEVFGGRQAGSTELVWGLLNAFPLDIDGSGESVVVIAFTNITERVKAELQLMQTETRARAVLESVIDGVIAIDKREVVTLFNPSAQRITGFKEADALGMPLSQVFRFSEEPSEEGGGENPLREGWLTCQNGQEIAVELLISEVQTHDETAGWVYTFRDVSEQQRIEQERATMDKMSSIGVLAGGIAHDFNNLLTAIYGNVALAESSMDDPEKAADLLRRSSESIQLATNLTKQLLTFSTGSEPVRDVVDMEKLVREAVRFSLSGSSVVANYQIDPALHAAEVDSGQVQQAISNIVLNAKQAMDDVGQIFIGMRNLNDDFVEVDIRDTGPGIPHELLGKVFDPYFTTKTSGTGLGLATTHSIVVKHGGSIGVESSPDTGTVFRMTFPATGAALDAERNDFTEAQVEKGLEVLVMDDEEIVLSTICRLLEHLGHQPTESRDGREAIAAYAEKLQAGKAFDLAIMDLTVAGGTGGTAAASKILEIDPNAKLIVSSGYSSGAEMARFSELGFCARLEKPFRASDLERIINEVMS